jgi:hypothetical protein
MYPFELLENSLQNLKFMYNKRVSSIRIHNGSDISDEKRSAVRGDPIPPRSRRCEAESPPKCHWETGKTKESGKLSQKNCPMNNNPLPGRRNGTMYA